MRKLVLLSSLVASVAMVAGCFEDPNDPKMWIKKLDDPRESKEAIRQLVKLKDKQAVEPLIALYKRSRSPELLNNIASFKDPSSVPTLIEALDYNEEAFDGASVAATALGEIGDKSAVEPLMKAVVKQLPVKTRANVVKLEGLKALGKLKDPRAVDALVKVLSTPADEQDFLLNQVAAKTLGEFADPKAVPALIRGLFMTGRGAGIYQECRTALIAIGEPAVDKLVEAMEHKFPELEQDAKKYEFTPGILVQKIGFVLGDLKSKKAVAPLLAELGKKDEGIAAGEGKGVPAHQGTAIGLGLIGDASAIKPLSAILADGKAPRKIRIAAAEALNMIGDASALPTLLAAAKTNFISKDTIDPDAGELAMGAVTAYSRLAGSTANPGFAVVPEEVADAALVFKNAGSRLAVAKECKEDAGCYEKYLSDADSAKAEKGAFMLARLGAPGRDALIKHVNASDAATRMAILFGVGRLGDKSCQACQQALDKQIATDESKPPLRALVQEMRAVRAQLSH